MTSSNNLFQTHIFCLVRELPNQKGIDRIKTTMKQYGMLANNPAKATVEQQAMEAKLLERVTAVKGESCRHFVFAVFIMNSSIFTASFAKRSGCGSCDSVFSGDVGLINMGMSEEDYAYLSTEIDFIIHSAAYVNLIYPYQVSPVVSRDSAS